MAEDQLNALELEDFLAEWKEEIADIESSSAGTLTFKASGKRKRIAYQRDSESPDSSQECTSGPKHPALTSEDVAPLLVLPVQLPAKDKHTLSKYKDLLQKGESDHENLVDALISDLDEINSIPFFDVELPREIAIIIFGYLDIKDLCNCSLVSKSWLSLANDNILWSRICQSMGYRTTTDQTLMNMVSWKKVVKDLVVQRRQVRHNWKERICKLCDHQPDNCGVLCCLSYEQSCILSCYSSGTIYIWNLDDDSGPTCVSNVSHSDHLHSPLPTTCAMESGWGVIGYSNGNLDIIDTLTCSHVQTVPELGSSIDGVSISSSGTYTAIAVATHHTREFSDTLLSNIVLLLASDGYDWERRNLLSQSCNKIMKVSLFPYEGNTSSRFGVLYSTSTCLNFSPIDSTCSPTSVLASVTDGGPTCTCITCFDFSSTTIACGTSAFGYQIQLYDFHSLAFKSSLRGHAQQVSCLNMATSPVNMVVSGSADKRVRVYDCRCSQPVLILSGHGNVVCTVQMDQWKVVSGCYDGTVIVWDQRMVRELWRSHERSYLVVGHIPVDKYPEVYTGNPHICHRRHRGLIRVHDFSVDPYCYTRMLPSICFSTYDEPSASFYNLDLKYPYDSVT